MKVFHYLALQFEALVILLQETQCTNAEKLVLSSYHLAESSLSRKNGSATFVHEQLRYALLDQSTPKSEIKWLCLDVDGYKIINVFKLPPTRRQALDLLVFSHLLTVLAISTAATLVGVTMITARMVSAWLQLVY